MALTPRPVPRSIDELLQGAVHREPFLTGDSKSGSVFERVGIDGELQVLKHVHPDRDWTMRFNNDVGCHPVQVWAAGLMDVHPDRVDHATVAVAGGLGRNGWGGAILMRDVGAELVEPGDTPPRPRHAPPPSRRHGRLVSADARVARHRRAGAGCGGGASGRWKASRGCERVRAP